jgi:hypothetical protein
VGLHLVAKTEKYRDLKTQKEKRRSPVSENIAGQELINQAVRTRLPFRFVLFDVWFASAETLVFLKPQPPRDFICPLKTNRQVALRKADKPQGRYVRVDPLELEAQATREIYLEGGDFPLVLVKQVFTNEDGSIGIRYLISSDTPLSFDDVTPTYHKRWGVEVCQSQPVKIAWRPLRLLIATMIYLRGLVKREDISDIDLFSGDDDFFDQTLGNDLPIGKGEALEVLA